MEGFKKLSEEERKILLDGLTLGNKMNLVYILNGAKSGGILENKNPLIKDLMKAFDSDKFDVFSEDIGCFVINKQETKKMISENIDFIKERLKLDNNATIEDIYNLIVDKENSVLKGAPPKYSDIFGMVMGYPITSTQIFELEQVLFRNQPKTYERRYEPDLTNYKNDLKDVLYSENSPYKDMSKKFKDNLAKKIDGIELIERATTATGAITGNYPFIKYVNDPKELLKIQNGIIECGKKLNVYNLSNEDKEQLINEFKDNNKEIDKIRIKKQEEYNKKIEESQRLEGLIKKNPEIYEMLTTQKSKSFLSETTFNRFNDKEIKNIISLCEKNPELVEIMIKEKCINFLGDEDFRFTPDEIISLKKMGDNNPELLEKLIAEKATNELEQIVPKYSYNEIFLKLFE